MLPVNFTTTALATANAASIAAAQARSGSGNLTLTASPVLLDQARRVQITSVGNDSGITFTVYGTARGGQPIQQTIAGANAGAVYTDLDFLTVTQIFASGTAAANVSAGTNTVASTQWFMPSFHLTPFNLEIDVYVSGTINYNVEYTLDDYYTPVVPQPVPAIVVVSTSQTATAQNTIVKPIRGWRITINSGSGTLIVKSVQAGIANY